MDHHTPSSPHERQTEGGQLAIEFRHVSLARKTSGVSGISFQLQAGETYAWLGGPGSGKTMIVDLIMGFLRPDFGTITVLGLDPASQTGAVRRSTSFVDGRGRLASPMTPVQNLTFFLALAATSQTHSR